MALLADPLEETKFGFAIRIGKAVGSNGATHDSIPSS